MSKKVDDLKTCLNQCILEIVSQRDKYSLVPAAFSRARKWPLDKLIHFILSFGSQSLGTEILEYFHFQEGFPTVSSFVQQRQKLSAAAMEELFRLFCRRTDSTPTFFKDYRLIAVDGSDLSLPYNPKEDNVIGDNHSSTLHLNCLYDVCGRVFLDAVIQKGKKENETDAACIMVDRLTESYPVIIMADRGYENYNLFAHIEQRLFDYIIRIRDIGSSGSMASGFDFPSGGAFDLTRDVVITRHSTGPCMINRVKYKYFSKKARFDYIENSKCEDYGMLIRFVRFQLEDGSYELVATSLPREEFSSDEIKKLYQMRWNIETGYREAKYILGMEAFHSKQENSVCQEIFARLIMYNFSMRITMGIKIPIQEKDLKHRQQVNFTQAVRICIAFFRYKGNEPPFDVETTITRFLLPVRPHRSRPRETVSASVVSFNYRLA
ncbi:MAG: IS4 family transposase [Lachnospiraceae bacterium]|nr:IS4 family transposase [Lachnospiraceae bacterium]